jgi:hypothetical protein
VYDVVIVDAAGLTTGIRAARDGSRALLAFSHGRGGA